MSDRNVQHAFADEFTLFPPAANHNEPLSVATEPAVEAAGSPWLGLLLWAGVLTLGFQLLPLVAARLTSFLQLLPTWLAEVESGLLHAALY